MLIVKRYLVTLIISRMPVYQAGNELCRSLNGRFFCGLFSQIGLKRIYYLSRLFLYQSNSFLTPFSISTLCVQPSEWSLDTSMSLRIEPSGLLVSNSTSPSKPTALTTNWESSRMVSSLTVPTLMWLLRISPRLGI